jgi:hypothetical protein
LRVTRKIVPLASSLTSSLVVFDEIPMCDLYLLAKVLAQTGALPKRAAAHTNGSVPEQSERATLRAETRRLLEAGIDRLPHALRTGIRAEGRFRGKSASVSTARREARVVYRCMVESDLAFPRLSRNQKLNALL